VSESTFQELIPTQWAHCLGEIQVHIHTYLLHALVSIKIQNSHLSNEPSSEDRDLHVPLLLVTRLTLFKQSLSNFTNSRCSSSQLQQS